MTSTDIANKAVAHIGGELMTNISTEVTQQARSIRKWYDPDGASPVYSALDECLRSHVWNFATGRKRQTVAYTTLIGASAIANSAGLVLVQHIAHGLVTGDRCYLKDVEGVEQANGRWYVTRVDADSFTLDDSVFTGTYTANTGKFVKIPQFAYGFQHTPPTDCLRVVSINADGGQLEDDGSDYLFEGGLILTNCETINLKYIKRVTTPDSYPADFVNAFSLLLASYIATDTRGNGAQGQQLRQAYENFIAPLVKARDGNEGKGRRIVPFEDSQLVSARAGGYFGGHYNSTFY